MNIPRGKLFVKEKVLLPDKISNGKAYFENDVLLKIFEQCILCKHAGNLG